MFARWTHRGNWFHIDSDPDSSARIVISALERYATTSGAWEPVDAPLRERSRPGLQEPMHEVSTILCPRSAGPMPRQTMFLLRTYPADDGGTTVQLQARVTSLGRIPKVDRFLRRIIGDLAPCSPVPVERPEHVRT